MKRPRKRKKVVIIDDEIQALYEGAYLLSDGDPVFCSVDQIMADKAADSEEKKRVIKKFIHKKIEENAANEAILASFYGSCEFTCEPDWH